MGKFKESLNESTKSKLDKADNLLKSLDFTDQHYIRNNSDWSISPIGNNSKDILDALINNKIKAKMKKDKIILL